MSMLAVAVYLLKYLFPKSEVSAITHQGFLLGETSFCECLEDQVFSVLKVMYPTRPYSCEFNGCSYEVYLWMKGARK